MQNPWFGFEPSSKILNFKFRLKFGPIRLNAIHGASVKVSPRILFLITWYYIPAGIGAFIFIFRNIFLISNKLNT